MPDETPAAPVIIALCTYNGARYLAAQLDSYAAQDHRDWDLWVSDDGSSDATLEILAHYARAWQGQHHIRILRGPAQGFAANFMTLLCHPELPAATIAISDQDDVWQAHKLSRALAHLAEITPGTPAIYGAQSLHTDADLTVRGASAIPQKPPSFANALTQNIISGHSTLINPAALNIIRQAGVPGGIPYHDWWLYQLVTGAGGQVIIDTAQVLSYRQHSDNLMGAHRGIAAKAQRLMQLFGGEYGGWIRANISALNAARPCLTKQALAILDGFESKQGTRLGPYRCARGRLHRQTPIDTAIFYLAALLRRL